MALPADQLGRPWRSRWIQRNAMTGLLPEAVCERTRKTNFDLLVTRGLFERETQTLRTILSGARCVNRNFVQRDWLERTLASRRFAAPDLDDLWLVASLELWLRMQPEPE